MVFYLPVEAAGGKALPCIVDVRDEKQVSEAVENAVQKFGGERRTQNSDSRRCSFLNFY